MHRRTILAAPFLLALPWLPAPAAAQPHQQAPGHAQGHSQGHAGAPAAQAGEIAILRPWTRAAGQGGTGAGFLAISNRGAVADRLVGASSPVARVTELHTHIREGDVMRMRPVPAIDLPAGQTVMLAPGGLHLMLIGLNQLLIPGQAVPVTLRFERAGELKVELRVEAAGARGPTGH